MIKQRKVTISINEWTDEANSKQRFSASVDFDFPVPRHGDEEEENTSGAVGVCGSSASEAFIKLVDTNVFRKYVGMLMEKHDQL